MDNGTNKKQVLILENKSVFTLDGVINVESFNDDYLDLSTNLGDVTVEGKNLKIEELCQENGKILVKGEISGFFYKTPKETHGFFGKMFK